jgi:hypothetical protein
MDGWMDRWMEEESKEVMEAERKREKKQEERKGKERKEQLPNAQWTATLQQHHRLPSGASSVFTFLVECCEKRLIF